MFVEYSWKGREYLEYLEFLENSWNTSKIQSSGFKCPRVQASRVQVSKFQASIIQVSKVQSFRAQALKRYIDVLNIHVFSLVKKKLLTKRLKRISIGYSWDAYSLPTRKSGDW